MASQSIKAEFCRSQILEWIKAGRFEPGQKLPAELELASELNVNHRTLRKALKQLVQEGVIVKQTRVGNFVSQGSLNSFQTDIAVILPEYLAYVDSHGAVGLVLRGIHEVFDPRRYNIHTLVYSRGRLWEDAGKLAVSKRVAGVLVAPFNDVDASELRKFPEAGIATVLMNPRPALMNCGMNWVAENVTSSLRQTLEHIYKLGHRRLMIFHFDQSNYAGSRVETINQFYKEHDLGNAKDALVSLDYDFDGGSRDGYMDALASRMASDTPPTAVIVPDEIVVGEFFRFCMARGIRVPQDLSVAAFTDYAPTVHAVPLTAPDSMSAQIQIASTAAKQLAHIMKSSGDEKDNTSQGIMINPAMCWKDSTGKVPTSDLTAAH